MAGAGALTVMGEREAAEVTELESQLELESEEIEEPEIPKKRKFDIAITSETIIISALIFIGIFAWSEFLRISYATIFSESSDLSPIWLQFGYCIFITVVILIFLYIVYRLYNPCEFMY